MQVMEGLDLIQRLINTGYYGISSCSNETLGETFEDLTTKKS